MKTISITGAAGNLGALTVKHLLAHTDCHLKLMVHRNPLERWITEHPRVTVFHCDLNKASGLEHNLEGVDAILHYASVLFKANPENFMPTTNTLYFQRVVNAAKAAGIPRVILTSFPHVEGETSPERPSTDRLDKTPISIHASTRLAEERLLREVYPEGIILRIGMVYGRGILMPDAARWFAQRRLLGIWKRPTWIHLISRDDYLNAAMAALINPDIRGTYNIGDEGIQTLQEYLDFACQEWQCPRPWRMPDSMIYSAATVFEAFSKRLNIPSPLTRDFLDIGHVSYYGDTQRMRAELLPALKYPTMQEGAEIF